MPIHRDQAIATPSRLLARRRQPHRTSLGQFGLAVCCLNVPTSHGIGGPLGRRRHLSHHRSTKLVRTMRCRRIVLGAALAVARPTAVASLGTLGCTALFSLDEFDEGSGASSTGAACGKFETPPASSLSDDFE